MTMNIRPKKIDERTLTKRRLIEVNGSRIETPTIAKPVDKVRRDERIGGPSTINEVYCHVTARKLKDSRRGNTSFADNIQRSVRKADDDEAVIVLVSLQEGIELIEDYMEHLLDILIPAGDFLPVPLMPQLAGEVQRDGGLSDEAYQTYRKNASNFVSLAQERDAEVNLVGTIPALGWEFTRDLFDLYAESGVRAFCLNFNRTRLTASRQISMVQPLMRNIAERDLEDQTMFYAINLNRQDVDSELGGRPAEVIAAVNAGIDIVGGLHQSPSASPKFFEDTEEKQHEKFRLFDRDDLIYRNIPFVELVDWFPEESSFEVHYILEEARKSDTRRRRLQKLVNAEQIALATADLQSAVDEDTTLDYLTESPGITPSMLRTTETVREALAAGQSQSGLDDFQ
jgi:hypothetical protein